MLPPTMTGFPGFTLPEELRLLGDQIRRFVHDEIIPLERTIDPDAPELPREDFLRLSAKTKAAGLWTLGAPEAYGGGGLDTFSMCVALEAMSQHRMGLYNPGCGVFGRYPPPAIWAGSKAQVEKYAVPALREEHPLITDLSRQSMLEEVDGVLAAGPLEQELLELGQIGFQTTALPQGQEQCQRRLSSEHGGHLKEALRVVGEPVDPRHQYILDGFRNQRPVA